MPNFRGFFALQASKPASDAGFTRQPLSEALPKVVLETSLGPLLIEVNTLAAPRTAANFLHYLDTGAYSGGLFHRTVTADNQPANDIRISVIQGSKRPDAPAFPPVPLESTAITGLPHLNGTISMARSTPDSATDQFFLCLGDQPELDFGGRRNPDGQGFAAFGRLLQGWLTLKKIQMAPAAGQSLQPPVQIVRARRL